MKKQRTEMSQLLKAFDNVWGELKRTQHYVDKIRSGQDRVHSVHSACKAKDREFVTADQLRRTKERINHAITHYAKLHEESVRRDHVLGESLLATQLGKQRRLLCRKDVHETL